MQLTRTQLLLWLVLLTVLAYANTTQNQFLWDDVVLVTNNSHIRNFHYLGVVFRSDLFHITSPTAIPYYRPIQTVSYMIDYAIWGLNPFGYHLSNLLLHLSCVLLLALLMEQLSANRLLATAVAGLFAVHPVLTNAVAYVAGRADMLAFIGMLSAWLLFLRNNKIAFTASLLCYLGALCSRENAFLFPVLIFLQCRILNRLSWRQSLWNTLPFLLLAATFAAWRCAVLTLHGPFQSPQWAMPWTLRIQIPFRTLATYLGLLVWPAHLQMERQVVTGGLWLYCLTAGGILATAVLIGGLAWSRKHCPLAFFGLWWFILTLLPVSGIFPLNATVAEHWLYVPCVGFFLAIVALVPFRRSTAILGLIALAALTTRTILRNQDWQDAITFYTRTKQQAPHSAAVRVNLGLQYAADGQTNQALSELLTAERLAPGASYSGEKLATFYLKQGDLAQAQGKLADALQLNPHNPDALMQVAMVWERRGDFRKARFYYLRAMAHTLNVSLRLEYGQFLLRHRRHHEALQIADEACALEPPNAQAHNLRGVVLAELGRFDEAQKEFETAKHLDRHSHHATRNLARLKLLRQQQDRQTVAPSEGNGASLR